MGYNSGKLYEIFQDWENVCKYTIMLCYNSL
jgi:hypothetical protein